MLTLLACAENAHTKDLEPIANNSVITNDSSGMQTPYVLTYNKTITNEMNATTSRKFYSVYDHNNKLVIHTSNKTLALHTLEMTIAHYTLL